VSTLFVPFDPQVTPEGQPTCAVDIRQKETMCRHLGTRNFGCVDVCTLFMADLERRTHSNGMSGMGYTIPCEKCLKFREAP